MDIPEISSTNLGALAKEPSDTTTQEKNYLGSQGANYRRYETNGVTKSINDWLTTLREGNHGLTLAKKKIITELSSPEAYGSHYV